MKQILYKLFEHRYLGRTEARDILQNIVQGKYNDAQIASLITVFLMRNISVEELTGFRDALLEMHIPVDLSEYAPIDIVGTGGRKKYVQYFYCGMFCRSRSRLSRCETWKLRSYFGKRGK